MRTQDEIRKEAKRLFDNALGIPSDMMSWSLWKRAFHLGFEFATESPKEEAEEVRKWLAWLKQRVEIKDVEVQYMEFAMTEYASIKCAELERFNEVAESKVQELNEQVTELEAENERLRGLVEDAYNSGHNHEWEIFKANNNL